jgi:dolichyl-diphosphooligosaccharide--protein glycosyltransferase
MAKSKPSTKAKATFKGKDVPSTSEEEAEVPAQFNMVAWALRLVFIWWILNEAYGIRLYAIKEYGRVIHEFDPWFNYRATEYLAEHGWTKFFHWYDHMSWYPLGRPVGTTIYPGMQITSVVIWETLKSFPALTMSLNDVCCFVPAWFGVIATSLVGLMTWECSGSSNAGVAASAVMAIVPAHIMRSVGGGYDNESIAVTAMCATFYTWCLSLRSDNSWWIGAISGVCYIYMVAVWGGYIFVLNMIGLHAALLVMLGRYSSKLHRSYSLWYIIGTAGATFVPVVGWTPLKSLEQLAPLGLFVFMQLMEFCEHQRRKKNLDDAQMRQLRIRVVASAGVAVVLVIGLLYPTGYFGPLSSRIRGLFVKHTPPETLWSIPSQSISLLVPALIGNICTTVCMQHQLGSCFRSSTLQTKNASCWRMVPLHTTLPIV